MGREKPGKPKRKTITVEMQEATAEDLQESLDVYREMYWHNISHLGLPHSQELVDAFAFGIAVGSRRPFYTEENENSFANAMLLITGYIGKIPG